LDLSTSAALYAKMGISIASVLAATAKGLKGLGGGSAGDGGGVLLQVVAVVELLLLLNLTL
jgi:hypothetical protein